MSQSDESRCVSPIWTGAPETRPRHALPVAASTAEQRAFAACSVAEPDANAGACTILDAQILVVAAGDRNKFKNLFPLPAPRAKADLIPQSLSPLEAEDLAISTMVEVWRAVGSFNPAEVSGQSWTFQQLRNVVRYSGEQPCPVRP